MCNMHGPVELFRGRAYPGSILHACFSLTARQAVPFLSSACIFFVVGDMGFSFSVSSRNEDTGALCMTTFRPLTSPPSTSTSSTSGSSTGGGHKRSDTETSKRDSGVLVEELDSVGPITLGLEECGTTGILSMSSLDRTLSRISRTCGAQSPPAFAGLGHGLKIVAKSGEKLDRDAVTLKAPTVNAT